MVTKERKAELIKKYGGTAKNTGSTMVQIAILTEDIETLKPHFATNKKDHHSRRGFMAKINKRKTLLTYLKQTDYQSYSNLIKALGIRK